MRFFASYGIKPRGAVRYLPEEMSFDMAGHGRAEPARRETACFSAHTSGGAMLWTEITNILRSNAHHGRDH